MSTRTRFSPAVFVWLLPAALALHAVAFWGTGLVDREGAAFIIDYLADRPMAAAVFDPGLNDWGTYQARELSYFVDYLDAQVFAALFARGVLWLVPTSGIVGLLAIIALYLRGARTCWPLDRITSALLLSWFLSTIMVQSSTAIYYRSAKILVAVCLAGLAVLICRPLRERSGISLWRLTGIVLVASAMSISDRQGFFFVAVLMGLLALWTVLTPREERPHLGVVGAIAAALLVAFGWGALYNNIVGPQMIYWLNEYWPDFSYQNIDVRAGLTDAETWRRARVLVGRQAEFLTGGAAVAVAAAYGLILYGWRAGTLSQPYGRRLQAVARDAILAGAAVVAVLVMTVLMVVRHPYVFTIVDHSYWYYFVPAHVLFLVGVSMAVARMGGFEGVWRYAAWTALVLMVAGNVTLYPVQRNVIVTSEWVKYQVARTDVIRRGWTGLKTGEMPSDIPRWVSVEDYGARLRLPVPNNDLFPDTVHAALTARAGRRRLDQAPGPHWGMLRDFFFDQTTPLKRLSEWPVVLEALRSVGIREIAIDPDRYADPAFGAETVETVRHATHHVLRERREGSTFVFTLADAPDTFRERAPLRRMALRESSVKVSHGAERVSHLLDGNVKTRWDSGQRQVGVESMTIAFDRPANVARLRLDLRRDSWADYPRTLRIESESAGQRTVLWEGHGLLPLVRSILRTPLHSAVEIDFPPNHTESLVIYQTAQTPIWFWSAHELAVWERR